MDELGKSLPVSESMIDSEQEGKIAGNSSCLNCGAPLTGKFCGQCGQKDLPRRQTIGDLLTNFLGSFFSFESKFFRTFGSILFKPGRIIKDYNAGRRERYYHPARMYVFLSFLFFLIFALIPDEEKIDLTNNGRKLSGEETAALLDTLNTIPWQNYSPKTIAEYDSIQKARPLEKRDGAIERYFQRKFISLKEREGYDNKTIWRTFGEKLQDNIPKMIFLLLPIFALLLKLLYLRRDFFYSEHLVFSVFFYDFLFLVGIIGLLCSTTSWLNWINAIIFIYAFYYLYKAMRGVYGQSKFKTAVKFMLLTWTFFFCILFGFVVNVLITLVLL
jgi:hypothetical protein